VVITCLQLLPRGPSRSLASRLLLEGESVAEEAAVVAYES
jgi:hypothetical protein